MKPPWIKSSWGFLFYRNPIVGERGEDALFEAEKALKGAFFYKDVHRIQSKFDKETGQ